VLLRGGRREAEEVDVAGVVEFAIDAAGEGVEFSDSSSIRSSVCILAEGPGWVVQMEAFTLAGGQIVRSGLQLVCKVVRFVKVVVHATNLGADLSRVCPGRMPIIQMLAGLSCE
jgi:hypothetical protein